MATTRARQFRLHLHRGISYLATPHAIRSIADLLRLAVAPGKTEEELAEPPGAAPGPPPSDGPNL